MPNSLKTEIIEMEDLLDELYFTAVCGEEILDDEDIEYLDQFDDFTLVPLEKANELMLKYAEKMNEWYNKKYDSQYIEDHYDEDQFIEFE